MALGRRTNEHSDAPHKYKLDDKSSFVMQESYKTIRTNLQFALAGSKNKSFIISSSFPAEGKSITCANIAITLAQNANRVLIIDADLRKPTQHKIFRVDNSHGLSTILVGFDKLGEAIHKDVDKNLDLITSGPIPPNPSELLGSNRMDVLLDKLNEFYDYIVIDTPPINVVTDAIVLAPKTAGVALVSRQKVTTYDEIKKALDAIEFAKVKVLGIIVNDINVKRNNKYYDYE
jgi:capsular exopolysaccharide synthesis family protein